MKKSSLAIASLIPIFLVAFGVLTLPDAPLIFFWTAALYTAATEFFPIGVERDRPLSTLSYRPTYRIALMGLWVGLACLSKYHGALLGAGLVGFCLTSSRHRRVLGSPWMLVSVGLFLLAIAPILIWNLEHDWVSLRFQADRAVPESSYRWRDMLGTALVGIAYLFPTFGVPLWWVSGRALLSPLRKLRLPSLRHRLVLWTALPLILGFTLMGGYRPILPTWAMPGFWSTTLLLGTYADGWYQRSPRAVYRWLWGSGWAIALLLVVALLHINLGLFQSGSRYALGGLTLAPENDASVQLFDICQVRERWQASPTAIAALHQADFVFTDNIYLAGQVGMAIAPISDVPVTVLDDDLRGFAFWSTAEEWVGHDSLYVATTWQTRTDPTRYEPYFESIQPIAELPLQRGGGVVQTLNLYAAQTLQRSYPRPY
ncbi:MAG: glycosyltransferase family 39 protein [Synechococcales cyanobacterium T60_A2020_003]|nr:glycosyltransferase family 39 protein [Synechococcales cyanobacterium T60_A2020_003]